MTEQQKISIRVLREQNFSYVAISRILELTLGAVRSYCQRCGLGGNRKEAFQADKPMVLPTFCKCCGKQVIQREKIKPRIFCSDECRVTWWNSHLDQVKRRNPHTVKCLCCGKEFTWYGSKVKKFCAHACYIKHRYEGVTYVAEAV
ncbi:hypothetical protein [Succinimonas amylolytica]|uniref:hypothetical protein n=1 Tax=Succinimonas amylolytica TaxID=83769 RepID=UPI0003789851|nr:hypothetical protein [Succinimonas amylolytica]